jgi:hypothetical protein
MLLKPVVPLTPVTVKDTVVDVADWFVAIVPLDICELVTFPLIARSTVAPLVVVAGTVVADGVGAGEGVGVGVGNGAVVEVCAEVEAAVGEGDGVGVGVGEGDGVGEEP